MSGLEAAGLAPDRLRQAFSCFPSGVTALGAVVEGSPVGMAVSSFTSVSLDPPLALVCVASTSATWRVLREAPVLGLTVLGHTHAGLCRQLSGPPDGRFRDAPWRATSRGGVLVEGAAMWMECVIEREVEAGDHAVVLLRVTALDADLERLPLVFHHSSFRTFAAGE